MVPNTSHISDASAATNTFQHLTMVVARLLISVIFLTSGIAKITAWDSNVSYMATRPLPFIPVLLAAALVIELVAAACLIVGYQTKIAAWIMFAYMVAVTNLFHTFGSTHYQKNLGIMGGLLMLAIRGAGAWALDSAFKKKES
jgi:putative oxidoreductase